MLIWRRITTHVHVCFHGVCECALTILSLKSHSVSNALLESYDLQPARGYTLTSYMCVTSNLNVLESESTAP